MSTYHRVILAKLKGEGFRRNRSYCKERSIRLIVAPKGDPIQEGDAHFSNLKNYFNKPTWTARDKAPWILEATWRLADQRMALIQTHMEYQ